MNVQLRIVAVSICFLTFLNAQVTIVHCGVLIDGKSDNTSKVMSVLIDKGTIIDVLEGYVDPGTGDTAIDLNNYTVLPGLMDMHTHLSGESNPKKYMERFTMDLDDYAYQSIRFAERTLMAGFTTVRDLGGPVNTSLRDAIKKGHLIGPRIFSAGKFPSHHGGSCGSNKWNEV